MKDTGTDTMGMEGSTEGTTGEEDGELGWFPTLTSVSLKVPNVPAGYTATLIGQKRISGKEGRFPRAP